MDRQLTSQEQSKGKFRKYLPYIVGAGMLTLIWWGAKQLITKSGKASDFHIVTVDKGLVRSTLSASGTVVAASERVINAPVATEIESVLLRTGAEVKPGDLILNLDQEYTSLEYEQLKDELALRKNNIDKLNLEYDKNLRSLDYDSQIKSLEVSELKAQLTDQKRLLQIGGATQEEVEAVDLKLKIATIEQQKLDNELQYRRAVNSTEKDNLQLEYNIQVKRLKELKRKLKETQVKAPSGGVITWINEDIGKTVAQGEPLVKIANLNRYRVEGRTSDRNSQDLAFGMGVEVRVGDTRLAGTISRILPEIVNNTVTFYIDLEEDDHKVLRPNLRTELYIIKSEKKDVLRAKRGKALKGTTAQYFYKVEGDKAEKVRVSKGIISTEYFEITDGLDAGDRIIISDTKDFDHMESFVITSN